jgi:hypothetical protein
MKWLRKVDANNAKYRTHESGDARERVNLLIDQLNPNYNKAR